MNLTAIVNQTFCVHTFLCGLCLKRFFVLTQKHRIFTWLAIISIQEAEKEEVIVREFEADETVCLLLEKLQFYETRLRWAWYKNCDKCIFLQHAWFSVLYASVTTFIVGCRGMKRRALGCIKEPLTDFNESIEHNLPRWTMCSSSLLRCICK